MILIHMRGKWEGMYMGNTLPLNQIERVQEIRFLLIRKSYYQISSYLRNYTIVSLEILKFFKNLQECRSIVMAPHTGQYFFRSRLNRQVYIRMKPGIPKSLDQIIGDKFNSEARYSQSFHRCLLKNNVYKLRQPPFSICRRIGSPPRS